MVTLYLKCDSRRYVFEMWHEEITFPREFIFVFTSYITREVLSKNVAKGGEWGKTCKGKDGHVGGVTIPGVWKKPPHVTSEVRSVFK